ncbi:hypothetical protein KSD_80800 [Ktedonobacter sp. SOSP1-85]|nr:hypothetical protein KSD_80800 [Ktedonobacter sp. SOSP1-85]
MGINSHLAPNGLSLGKCTMPQPAKWALTETVAWAPLPVYALTCICSVEYTKCVEPVFEIIAEPKRRAIRKIRRKDAA